MYIYMCVCLCVCMCVTYTGEGERVSLGKNLKARGNVEKWLCDVEASMISE